MFTSTRAFTLSSYALTCAALTFCTVHLFSGLDSSVTLNSRGGIPMPIGNLLEIVNQHILVEEIGRIEHNNNTNNNSNNTKG